MTDDAPEAERELPSPCIAVCLYDSRTGFCQGYYRTLDEIDEWPAAPHERKQEILRAITERMRPGAG